MPATASLATAAGSEPLRLQAQLQIGFLSRAEAFLPTPRQYNLTWALHQLQELLLLCLFATKLFSSPLHLAFSLLFFFSFLFFSFSSCLPFSFPFYFYTFSFFSYFFLFLFLFLIFSFFVLIFLFLVSL